MALTMSPQNPNPGGKAMNEGEVEVLEKVFVCTNCEQTRITIQMLRGRTVPVTCRACEHVYEIIEKNGEVVISELTPRRKEGGLGAKD